jgi:hypothetical protein
MRVNEGGQLDDHWVVVMLREGPDFHNCCDAVVDRLGICIKLQVFFVLVPWSAI